jgi:hypothetical protein
MVVSRDLVAGVVLLVASIGYYVTATGIPVSLIDTTVNSSALPKLLGIGGAGLSIVLIVQGLLKQRRQAAAAAAPADAPAPWLQHKRALGILIIVVAYALLLDVVGYFVSMALMLAATAYYQAYFYRSVKSVPVMTGLALGGALLFWAIFDLLVGIPMPEGLWRHFW